MSDSEKSGALSGFLRKLKGGFPAMTSEVSVIDVLKRLADIECDATAYYEGIAQHSDLPWVREFASRLADAEKRHRDQFLAYADQLEGSLQGASNRLATPLTEELSRLLAMRITLPGESAERTAVYLSEKDAVEVAIQAERNAIRMLSQLRNHVPAEQHVHLDRVVAEEQQHQAFLENLLRERFG